MKIAFVALFLVPTVLFAQEPQPGDQLRILLPIVVNSGGLLNTSWRTDVVLHNGNGEPVVVTSGTVLPSFTIPPFATTGPIFPPAGNPGVFLYVPKRLAANVATRVRVHDVTRDSDSWGVEIPGVVETDFATSMVIAAIPSDSRFRSLLRVYDDNGIATTANVTLRDDASGELIDRRTLLLAQGDAAVPAYAQLALDPILLPAAAAHPVVRAEITATSSTAPPLWAFVSITNNTTQQVTTLLSHPASVPPPSALQTGHWGGGGVCVDVTDTQIAVSAGCSVGTFIPPSAIGPDGRFEADGFWLTTAGPVRINSGPGQPAHVSGIVQGTTLTLTVTTSFFSGPPLKVQFGSKEACTGNLCV